MKASDIMSRRVISIGSRHGVQHAAQLMLTNQIGGLPVFGGKKELVGVVTDGELIRHLEPCGLATRVDALVHGTEPDKAGNRHNKWRVADCMSANPITVSEDTSVKRIATLMIAYCGKRLPVMKAEKMVGIVCRRDLLAVIVDVGCDRSALEDQAINSGILAWLNFDLHLPDDFDAIVSNGQVKLIGEAESLALYRAAGAAAEDVSGVCGVKNELRVRSRIPA